MTNRFESIIGQEHIKEHLNIQFDFKPTSPSDKLRNLLDLATSPMFDRWESRRYELVKQMVIEKAMPIESAVAQADRIINALT